MRYLDSITESVEIKRNVLYGSNKTQGGTRVDLYMDVYLPANDTCTARPVIILAHGGYYLYGSKENFSHECLLLAQAGFIAATINYRLIDVSESQGSYKRATADAVNDTKAAVRFFRRDKCHQNFFQADTAQIFIGGFSAGAITSLHYAYCTTPRDVFAIGGPQLVVYMTIHGGYAGDSGNAGYSSAVRGVINLSGSIHAAWMLDADEPALFSVHGTADEIVPMGIGKSGDSGVRTEGSERIHQRAEQVGLVHEFLALYGEDHAAYFDCDSCHTALRKFLHTQITAGTEPPKTPH